jgi:hypothetical protein
MRSVSVRQIHILHGHVEVCNFFLGKGAWYAECSENKNGEIN